MFSFTMREIQTKTPIRCYFMTKKIDKNIKLNNSSVGEDLAQWEYN